MSAVRTAPSPTSSHPNQRQRHRPGYMATDNTQARRDDPIRSPAARWGTPEDLQGADVFLAPDASAYVHGTTITVDGGWLSR
jgi:2-dehydro-3-deoxy-D-gluconate 5-dehydrogenase